MQRIHFHTLERNLTELVEVFTALNDLYLERLEYINFL